MTLKRFSLQLPLHLDLTRRQERVAGPSSRDHLDFGEGGRDCVPADPQQLVNPAYIRSEVARWAGEREKREILLSLLLPLRCSRSPPPAPAPAQPLSLLPSSSFPNTTHSFLFLCVSCCHVFTGEVLSVRNPQDLIGEDETRTERRGGRTFGR